MQLQMHVRVRPTHSLSLGTPSNIYTPTPSHYQNIYHQHLKSLFLSATHSCTLNSLSLIIPMKPPQQQLPKSFPVSSSPGRPEKLPAPGLARLLRGKSSGTIRASTGAGQARSSPMLVSRTKSLNLSTSASAAADGEPTSPKVTCIGQVRIRKRHKKNINKHTNKKIAKDLRSAERKTSWCLFDFKFRILPKRKKKRECCKFFCWRRNRHHHHQRSSNNNNEMKATDHEAPPIAFVREIRAVASESEEEDEETSSSASATMHSSNEAGPPKNALLLMRCRSAPHNRSSALSLCRFPVSPVPASESEEDEKEATTVLPENNYTMMRATEVLMSTTTMVPLSLIRCKSEPAKSGEKLMQVKWNGR